MSIPSTHLSLLKALGEAAGRSEGNVDDELDGIYAHAVGMGDQLANVRFPLGDAAMTQEIKEVIDSVQLSEEGTIGCINSLNDEAMALARRYGQNLAP